MARIRSIKPEAFLHEELFDLEKETGWPMRWAFAGLWCHADKEGRFPWKPRTLKAGILPHDEIDFSRVLDAFATRGFIVRYASQGVEFGWIPGFKRHQYINGKEPPSILPPCPQEAEESTVSRVSHALTTREPRVDHAFPKEGKGREGSVYARQPTLVQSTRHLAHAGRVQVPGFLHGEFLASLGGLSAAADLDRFYLWVEDQVEASQERIPDQVKFARKKFAEWVQATHAPPSQYGHLAKCAKCGQTHPTDVACGGLTLERFRETYAARPQA